MFGAIDRRALAAEGELVSWPAGKPIVTEGDPGDRFYALIEGEARVTIDGQSVRTLLAGDWFGEIALLHDAPRTATVTATVETTLWALGRDGFLVALGQLTPAGSQTSGVAVAGAGLLV
jgi:CRP-like cAMP-binding protein